MFAKLASLLLGLSPKTHDYELLSARAIEGPGGARLMHDHYRPVGAGALPTILVRTPYNRADPLVTFWYKRFAERGYNVIVQDCRGRFGSTGAFDPFAHEREDGLATIDWIDAQPWHNGALGMWGASYNGFTQWAVADSPKLRAITPLNTSSDFYSMFFPSGTLALETMIAWLLFTDGDSSEDQDSLLASIWRLMSMQRRLKKVQWTSLPLGGLDRATLGATSEFFQRALKSLPQEHAEWELRAHRDVHDDVRAQVHLMSGWDDLFLRETIADYEALREHGKRPSLTIGPFSHSQMRTQLHTLKLGLEWFERHLASATGSPDPLPVKIYVTGADAWRSLPDWPPKSEARALHLHGPGGRLATHAPDYSAPTEYRYDPRDPTPSVGGPSLFGEPRLDNRKHEARADVCCFTSNPQTEALEIIGAPTVTLYASCSRAHFDLHARLCVVGRDGRSHNLCDGILRVGPDDGSDGDDSDDNDGARRFVIPLSPIAHRLEPRERVRLQISSGAHPRFARNLGAGDPHHVAVDLHVADVALYHDPERPSALVLPVTAGRVG